ncbi:sigma-54 interaction domain-containing protein [Sinimarinibacterium thermocellulolyticum]|uniref:Sigma-54 dependent transcriptional regulator n=1 Tax=Sinimarinibacterium thermocellulolyticum TaxID=3170016 RepID=A0ABV2A864_9GAMM
MPVRFLRIDELVPAGGLLTLAEWSRHAGMRARHELQPQTLPSLQALDAWAGRGQLAVCEPGGQWSLPFALIDGFEAGEAGLVGALRAEGRLVGLALVRGGDRPFDADEQALFTALLEPLTAAVVNDRRLREIRRLGAAAEADRQSLLTRLGRDSVFEHIVGAERGLRHVMERVDQVAPTDASVLILGETGAGKEVIARAIHERSARRDGPFVRVNCGALPPELIDSELFGHEKGSFTGALAARRGWFERADGGTLFLDEVGELSLAAQVRLLRVLQDGVVQRVGGEKDLAVDVRVIAATHRDLPSMVQERSFREDLWYRLAVFPLILPPLRERPQDIPALTQHFVQRAAKRLGVTVPLVRPADIERLQAYRWPGNVREFAAVIERAVILGQGTRLEVDAALGIDAPRQASQMSPAATRERDSPSAAASVEGTGIEALDTVIQRHLQKALRATRGRVDGPHGAARLLGVNASTLRAKLRKHRIDPRAYRG